MALYDTLPIYKATYDFLIRVMRAISHFPREYKYSLGERLQNEVIEMIILIYKANRCENKVNMLTQLDEQVQLVYLLLRVSHDMRLLPTDKYAGIVEMADNIACQTKGWLKANEKMREPAGS